MFVGIIKTKDILLNPRTIISMRGVRGFMKLVYRALRKQPYSFIGMTQESDWIFDQNVQDELHKEAETKAAAPKETKKKETPAKHHEAKKTRHRR
ncbi:MAG TPA: hypothetical protein VFX30_08285 [bacterium]|nr:hypothetical protein [bacterium]